MTDCTRKCASRHHGDQMTSAVTRRAVSDEALAAYLRRTCAKFTQALDSQGRTVLHMAASRGRRRLVEWLARNSSEAFLNAKDHESGYTPLHRSLFYGQIHVAVALMKMGASLEVADKDDYSPLDHVVLDRRLVRRRPVQPCDAYVWGSNANYTLGTPTHQQRNTPEPVCFPRNNTHVKQVCLGKFHSVFVDEAGGVWACGQGSRFGAPHAGTVLSPKLLYLREREPCKMAAVMLDSTIFLLESGLILQYKMNECENTETNIKSHDAVRLGATKPLMKMSGALGLCASRNHVMVWKKSAIYSWGLNYGQLGHSEPSDKYVDSPKRVAVQLYSKEETSIQHAAVSEGASVFNTSRGDVYLLHDHICKKIAIKQINIKQLSVECKVHENGSSGRVVVLLLTNLGHLLLWYTGAPKLTRCVFGLLHETTVTSVALTHDAFYFTNDLGQLYQGNISFKSTPSTQPIQVKKEKDNRPITKLLEKDDCTSVRIKKVPNIHRAVSITTDTEALNFACLQLNPHNDIGVGPSVSQPTLPFEMDCLRTEAFEDDLLHDVVFQVGGRVFPAHIFVVASGSDFLYSKYQESKNNNTFDKPTVTLKGVHPDVFERVLKYLYTGECDVTTEGASSLRVRKQDLVTLFNKDKVDEGSDETQVETFEPPSEMSAFEAYKKESEHKRGKGTRNKSAAPRDARTPHEFCDPVKLVQATAKRLHVTALHKHLDRVYFKDGCVRLKDSASADPPATLLWRRDAYPELHDTTVRSKDNVDIPAHKCVLAARLDYFRGMFMHSWSESEKQSTVTLPINHTILETIIDFLYTDTCNQLDKNDNIDFLCNLLIVADQLFVSRLRQMCERSLSSLLTLKNCAEMCQFAHTYNCVQLKNYCMEFMCLNLCTMLENKYLHIVENELLEHLAEFYCSNNLGSCRIITTFYNAPDEEIIIECGKLHPVDMMQVDEDLKIVETKKKKKTPKKGEYTESEKARMRYESVSSVNSIDISHDKPGDVTLALNKLKVEEKPDENKEKWVKVMGQQKQQKVVQARLKAISVAKEILNEKPVESFTKLPNPWQKSSPISITPQEATSLSTSRMSESPKDAVSENPWKSPQSPIFISHIGAKLSQKQRKKLALQGVDPAAPQNLDDFLTKKATTEGPSTPRNPWKVCEVPNTSGVMKKPVQFNQILADEQKQKENSSRIMSKSLVLTQLEDKAIEELERFYNVEGADDERIVIRRIEIKVSSPQWVNRL